MDEWETGRQTLLQIVQDVDSAVEVVIPTAPSNGQFLLSLTKGAHRKFITVSEDDLIDLSEDEEVRDNTTFLLKETIGSL